MPDATRQKADERRRRYFLALSEALRQATDPAAALSAGQSLLGEHLAASRVAFARPDGEVLVVEDEWLAPGIVSSVGRHHFTDVSPDALLRGEARCSPDITRDDRIGPDTIGKLLALQVRSGLDVPVMRDGAFIALLTVHQDRLRGFTDEELSLAEETAERTWVAVERLQAEAAERETRALLQALMQNAPIGIYVKDAAGRYQMANPQMGQLLDVPAHAIVGHTARELVDPAKASEIEAAEQRVLETLTPETVESYLPRNGGPYEWTLVTRFPVQTRPDGPIQVAGFDMDITSRKRTEADLLRSQETLYQTEKLTALGSLLAGVSHELNNPLSIVVAQSEMMEIQSADTALADRAREIRIAAERCARIVQTFLAMARHRPPERRAVDLNAVVETVLELVAYNLRSHGIEVEHSAGSNLPIIWADPDQLHQVIVNLVVNAQHAMQDRPGERRLQVVTRASGRGHVEVEISDTGPGVPDDIRRRIFEPFFTTKAQGIGTGVGLSFSLGLVEAHGGVLRLAPNGPGKGAVFQMILPIGAATADDALVVETEAARALGRRCSLVVDDEPAIGRLLAEYLLMEGFDSDVCTSGADAVARLQTRGYDLIVSDLRMPELDGPALYAWIKAERPELARVTAFATGDTLGAEAARFLNEERRPFIEKPFTRAAVNRLLSEIEDLA